MGSTVRRPPAGRSSSEARPVSARAASLAPSSKRPSTVAPRPWSVRAYPAHRLGAVRAVRRSAPRATRSTEPGRLAGLLGPARDEMDGCSPRWVVRRERPAAASYSRPRTMEADRAGQGRLFEAILTVFERLGRNGPIVARDRGHPMGGRWDPKPHRVPVAKPPEPAGGTARDARTDDPDPLVPTTRLLGELERQVGSSGSSSDP